MKNLERWPTDGYGIQWKPGEFDPEDMEGLFLRLEAAMDACGEPRDAILQPGASEDEIRSSLAALPVDLHDDVMHWFQWTRGPVIGSAAALMSVMSPISLDRVVERFWFNDDGIESPWYEGGRWVPILTSGAIDCGSDWLRGTFVDVAPMDLYYNRIPGLAVLLWSWIGLREEGLHPWGSDVSEARKEFFALFPVMQNRVDEGFQPIVNF